MVSLDIPDHRRRTAMANAVKRPIVNHQPAFGEQAVGDASFGIPHEALELLRRCVGLVALNRDGCPAPSRRMRAEAHLLSATDNHGTTELHVPDLRWTVAADQYCTRSPRPREPRDRLSIRPRMRQVRLDSTHSVHETETCWRAGTVGLMNAEVTFVLHDAALNGVFVLLVHTKSGTVGCVEWLDSDEGSCRGVRLGDGRHVQGRVESGRAPKAPQSAWDCSVHQGHHVITARPLACGDAPQRAGSIPGGVRVHGGAPGEVHTSGYVPCAVFLPLAGRTTAEVSHVGPRRDESETPLGPRSGTKDGALAPNGL